MEQKAVTLTLQSTLVLTAEDIGAINHVVISDPVQLPDESPALAWVRRIHSEPKFSVDAFRIIVDKANKYRSAYLLDLEHEGIDYKTAAEIDALASGDEKEKAAAEMILRARAERRVAAVADKGDAR